MVPPSVSDATDERFTETAWSVVLAAGAATPARAHTAMAELCRIYWRPIYAYLRRSGHPRHEAEEIHHLRADHEAAPDEILDVRWAGVVLERALDKVRAECAAEGKANLFEALSPFLGGIKPHASYQEVADRMNLGLGAVKTLIYRLRQQFASAVRHEIIQTVSAPHEVDDELRRLRG